MTGAPRRRLDQPAVASAAQPHRIALLIDTATTWGAGLIEGIVDYARGKGRDWLFTFEPTGKYERFELPESWQGDGVIARITTPQLAGQIIARNIPAINVSWFRFGANLIRTCTCDETQAAEMAFSYFVDLGYRQFAYCRSTLRPDYYDRLQVGFAAQVSAAGYPLHEFSPSDTLDFTDAAQVTAEIGKWVAELPRPVALLTFDSIQGRIVTEACSHLGIAVPDDVAVLGGEHDELSSRVSRPPLSGIDQSPHQVGYQAAKLLDGQLAGNADAPGDIRLPPDRIIVRQSTDKVAVDDEMLAEAIRYIHRHYAEPLRISDILAAVPLSRRGLEIGFRDHLGRTPREEIRRVRVQKSIELLCDTDLSVTAIAQSCGFDRPELFTRAFRREVHSTPTEYRRSVGYGTKTRLPKS